VDGAQMVDGAKIYLPPEQHAGVDTAATNLPARQTGDRQQSHRSNAINAASMRYHYSALKLD
jgi:hypothetical protein